MTTPTLKPLPLPPSANTAPPVINQINPALLAPVNPNDPQFASGLPDVPAPQLQKVGLAPPTPLQQNISADQGQLQKLRVKDANPYGSANNHPGVMGKILHTLSVAGNIAGDIFAPTVMANVPGTDLNRELQEGGLVHRLNSEQDQQSQEQERDAATAQTQATTAGMPQEQADKHALGTAEARHINDESAGMEQPAAPDLQHFAGDNGFYSFNPKTGEVQQLSYKGQPVSPVQKPAEAPRTIQIEEGGKPHQMAWDAQSGKYDLDQGESGEKPPVVRVSTGPGAQSASADPTLVDAIGNGNVSLRDALPYRSTLQERQQLINAVVAKYPQFNSNLNHSEGRVQEDFTSGAEARTLNSFNTATQHLNQLQQAATALQNGDIQSLNRFSQGFARETGSAAPTNFGAIRTAVAGEVAKVFKGVATDAEIKNISDTITNAQSPQQLQGAIGSITHLMGSKRDALQQQYKQGMRGTPNFNPDASDSSTPAMMYARDPQGKLHQAPAGSTLPAGWKAGK